MSRMVSMSWIAIISITLLLSGCWDERLLRDHSLVLSVGYDRANEEELLNTITFPVNAEGGGGAEAGTTLKESKVVSVTGNTAKDAEKHMDQSIPEKFDRSKTRLIFFGEDLAKKGVFPILDSVYRDLNGSLNAKVAIFEGKAKEALSVHVDQSLLTSDMYAELLDSAQKAGITKNDNVQNVCPVILTEGKDIILPYVDWKEDTKEAVVKGVALFVDDKMTGTLNIEETSTLLMLMDEVTKNLSLNLKISDEHKESVKNYVNIAVRKNKRKLKIEENDGKVRAKVDINLEVEIDEFAANRLYNTKRVKNIEKDIEKRLNQVAENTIEKIQEANSDALGIGQRVKAYHHDVWEETDWKKEYPNIEIKTNFTVDIIRHGILN